MEFILFIIVLVILIYQNSKINDLKRLIKGGNSVPVPPAPQTASNPQSASGSIPSVMPQAPSPASMAEAAAPVPSKSVTPESSEEMSGRILGRIGIAAVIVGIGFFLKYAFDNNWVGPAGRVMIGVLAGIILLGLGQWLRKKYLNYSDLLMGGGLAVLYLSIYAAYALYGLMDPINAFMCMAIVTALGVGISVMNATMTLSVVAFIGGYITPAIIGVNLIGPWITFTYLTILNCGVLGILVSKKWAPLTIIGLIGTWLHFGTWLASSYNSTLLIPTLFFILVQFLIFTAASVIRIIVEKAKANELDYFVLSITAITFASACYYLLMPDYKHYVSLGSVLVAVLYGAIALVAYKENPEDRTINIFLPGLAVAFLTIAIPIEFSGPWIPAWWFVEAIILYVVASKSSSRGFQVMGVVVYILGLIKLFWYVFTFGTPSDYVVFFNGPFIMLAFAVATAYVISFVYYRYGSISAEIRERGIGVFTVIANVLTLYALTLQISAYYNLQALVAGADYPALLNSAHTSISILWALYAALLTAIGFAKKYATVRRMGLVLFIVTGCKVVVDVWSLGQLYRIVSFIIFGVIALIASFMYVKYKDRLKDIV